MSLYDRGWLAQITAAEKYRRYCNGREKDSSFVTGANLRAVLAVSEDVKVAKNGVITWRGPAGEFTAEPVRDEPVQDEPAE